MTPARALAALSPLAALLLAGCIPNHLAQEPATVLHCQSTAPPLELGCANAANLAAMVADPADLKRGRALTPASGAHAAQAIEAYETPPPPHDAAADVRTETTR